jgi:Uma2 family endonuclease
MDTTAERMTVEDYYAITVEGDRKQLVDGRVVVVNEGRYEHAVLQARLLFELAAWINEGEGRGEVTAPTDVRLDEHNLFGPDLLWVAERHRPTEGRLERVPDICVEIRSPSTWRYDLGKKKDAYERSACPELWLVDDRARSVLVYRRSRSGAPTFDVALEPAIGDQLTSPQLPGFALAIERLFRDL